MMRKYLQIFKISFQQELAYRASFVMWRVRNVMQIFLVFFLWDAVFSDSSRIVFGYDRVKILTYVFLILILKSIVTSTKTVNIAGEIASGNLTNYLLKPMNFFKYWLTRDIASKTLNLMFAVVEVFLLYLLLKPPFFIQNNFLSITIFFIVLILAVVIFFLLLSLVSLTPLWLPEQTWGPIFLLITITEFLSGGIFPLDILPQSLQNALYLTPFPYLLFVPAQVYLGKFSTSFALKGMVVAVFWIFLLLYAIKKVWTRGLLVYRAEGR